MSIIKQDIALSTGDDSTVAQYFFRNTFVDRCDCNSSLFEFNVPLFGLTGATFDYYAQNTRGISTNLNNIKSIKYEFSANSYSISGTTQLVYDVYRLEYDKFISARDGAQIMITASTISGATTANTTLNEISTILSNPFYTFKEDGSGVTLTNNVYTLTMPQVVKPTNQFAQDLFLDKGQYFFDTRFEFDKFYDNTLGDYMQYSADDNAFVSVDTPVDYKERWTTEPNGNSITGGTFSGITFYGANFTYFKIPNKPNIDVVNGQPTAIGTLDTYSPLFSFNNVDDGDYYKLQVSYDMANDSFSGNTTIFTIPKQEGDAEFIRTYAVSLNPNSDFLYRIGNTKEIINIFGVKQNVTTWGNSASAITANNGFFSLEGTTYYNNISPTNLLSGATLSLTLYYTSSSVDLSSDNPEDPEISPSITTAFDVNIGGTVSVISDANGNFDFGTIKGGIYQITASHPSYYIQTQLVNLDVDKDVDILFNLYWGNEVITFAEPITFL